MACNTQLGLPGTVMLLELYLQWYRITFECPQLQRAGYNFEIARAWTYRWTAKRHDVTSQSEPRVVYFRELDRTLQSLYVVLCDLRVSQWSGTSESAVEGSIVIGGHWWRLRNDKRLLPTAKVNFTKLKWHTARFDAHDELDEGQGKNTSYREVGRGG